VSDELKVIEGGVTRRRVEVTQRDGGLRASYIPLIWNSRRESPRSSGQTEVAKSNFADAIRWALGENNARVLRAKRNEELIFGGSETRKALSHAEALLQLDNSSRRLPIDFTEIEVGRRLFRNGEAEYLVKPLARAPARSPRSPCRCEPR